MKEISIIPNYFGTLQFQENTLINIQKPSRRKKNFISENVYVGNLDPAVMTLSFGGTRCCTSTSPIGQSQHQYLRLIRTHHLAQTTCSLICSQCNNSHADCAKCCVRINRKCWCCDKPISDVLIMHRVSPKCSAITVEWRLTMYIYFVIKIFLSF